MRERRFETLTVNRAIYCAVLRSIMIYRFPRIVLIAGKAGDMQLAVVSNCEEGAVCVSYALLGNIQIDFLLRREHTTISRRPKPSIAGNFAF